jgi:hypothetical protein
LKRRLVALAAALSLLGCGKKVAPQAPLQVVPARPDSLVLAQEGTDIVLRFSYPKKTVTGEALTDLSKVSVYRELVAARPDAKAPPPPEGPARAREEQTFKLRAQKILELSRADLDESTVGSEVIARDTLIPLFEEKKLGKVFLRYAVSATRGAKGTGDLSPLTSILPVIPPGNPVHLVADVEERRVCLSWLAPVDMLDGTRPPTVKGYVIYRRKPGEDEYGAPLGIALKAPLYVDETALSGQRYLYTVRASDRAELPLVLGPPADEILVDTTDVFAPAMPDGLLVLVEQGANRVLWNPVLASDLAGYRVFRREPDGSWRRLADNLKEPSYVDQGAPKDAVYGVTAVDATGNESRRAEAAAKAD